MDKFEDVSIYYLKNEQQNELLETTIVSNQINATGLSSANPNLIATSNLVNPKIDQSLYVSQKNENFNDKLRLWKCCTLVKHHNLTLEKILNRIKNERYIKMYINYFLISILRNKNLKAHVG